MKTKVLMIGAVVLGLTAAGVAFATSGLSDETSFVSRAVSDHAIPGTLDVSSSDWTLTGNSGPRFESDEKGVGYVKTGSVATIDFHCNKSGAYNMLWTWDNRNDEGNVDIVIEDLTTGDVEIDQNWVKATGESTIPLEGVITAGDKRITLTITASHGNYIGNYFSPSFEWVSDTFEYTGTPTGWDVIPGALDVNHWTYEGMRVEKGDEVDNVGYVKNGCKANHKFFCSEQGVYEMEINFYSFFNPSDLAVTVADRATKKIETETKYHVGEQHVAKIILPGVITVGKKDIQFDAISDNGGFLFNYYTPVFKKVGEAFAMISGVTPSSSEITPATVEGFDMAFNIPSEFKGDKVEFTVGYESATLEVSGEGVEVTNLGGGKYSIPVPAPNAETLVTLKLNPQAGAVSEKNEYEVRFFRIGGVVLTGLAVNSIDVEEATVEAINSGDGVVIDDYVFTAVPAVTATFIDGSSVEATSTVSGSKATYTFTGKTGDKSKNFSFVLDGLHIFNRAAGDKDAKLVYDSASNQSDGSWSNGLYTINRCNDGWGGSQFKLGANSTVILTAPADMKVKQLVLAQLSDNYHDGKIKSITSGDATVWLPSESSFTPGESNRYDLVVNVENHVAGTPFEIEIENGGQPVMWFEFVYETVVPTTAPELVSTSTSDLTGKNHAVVTFTMNREITDTEITFNGQTVKGTANGVNLSFPLWDLDYNKEYTLTIPAGIVKDTYGNKNNVPLTCKFTTGVKDEDVVAIDDNRFKVVSDVEELKAAIESLAQTNKDADSKTTVIYILDGDYDLGNISKSDYQYESCLSLGSVYNVSLIGESQDGVLIHGTRTGITSPILSTQNSTNVYMENFTLRNDFDFGTGKRSGVGVAHYGGHLDIMKNVTLQSNQDTQVTGERGYYLNCTFHGSTDYICGAGDHYYDACTFVQEFPGPITAPMTTDSQKHGYVFQNCVIKGVSGYTLGRPWKNEPRCFWLNTTMHSLPAENGWDNMGNLTTHFYEHNSMDANGNKLDLSKRVISESSSNKYTPILPAEYASYFTPRNVLGSTDSWDAESLTAGCEAPVVTLHTNSIKWTKVNGAAGYIVYQDGKTIGYTNSTEYALPAVAMVPSRAASEPAYTVAAVSTNGARGAVSEVAKADGTLGIGEIDADIADEAEFYNLQGIKVAAGTKGMLIRVTYAADGHRVAEKVVIK